MQSYLDWRLSPDAGAVFTRSGLEVAEESSRPVQRVGCTAYSHDLEFEVANHWGSRADQAMALDISNNYFHVVCLPLLPFKFP